MCIFSHVVLVSFRLRRSSPEELVFPLAEGRLTEPSWARMPMPIPGPELMCSPLTLGLDPRSGFQRLVLLQRGSVLKRTWVSCSTGDPEARCRAWASI